jgi:cell division protease FtsH
VFDFYHEKMSGGGGGSGQIFNIGKSKAKLLMKNRCKTTFKDVGLEGAKEEIQEIVEFLKTQRNTQTSVVKFKRSFTCRSSWNREDSISGCWRSASAIFSLSGSDFVEMFVGVGASRVRDLFKQAKEKSPALFLSMKLMP